MESKQDDIKESFQELIDLLFKCDKEGKKCKHCKYKNECIIFLRTTLGVCLQYILASMMVKEKEVADIYQ